jgi:hypothetical protein
MEFPQPDEKTLQTLRETLSGDPEAWKRNMEEKLKRLESKSI